MKIGVFTGVICLNKDNPDVRKQYIIERLKYFTQDDISFEIITPYVSQFSLSLPKNIEYNMYKFINKKHMRMVSATVYSMSKLLGSKCELIHCYTLQAAALACLVNYFRKEKFVIIFEPMGLLYAESELKIESSIKVKILRPFIKYTEELIFQKSDVIVVYTALIKNYLSQKLAICDDKIYVIPHGVDLTPPGRIDKNKVKYVYNKLNIPENNRIILYTGSLSELHGTPFLMKAIGYVIKKRQDVSFLILGRGELENNFKSWMKENNLTNVHLGFVPSNEVTFYLSLADILLIPHAKCLQTELDQPTKLFEYLVSGKPIVSFNLKAIAEVLGNNAVLVEPDNPKALAGGILTLIDNERLCREFGEKGISIVKEYSWEVSAKKQYYLYKHLYENFMKNQ